MDKVDELLRYVQKTNPEMTRKKLMDELSRSDYAARSLIFTDETFRKNFQSPLP
jgi:hypothetical protein